MDRDPESCELTAPTDPGSAAARFRALGRLSRLDWSFDDGVSPFTRAAHLLRDALGEGVVCSIWGGQQEGMPEPALARLALALPGDREPQWKDRITVLPCADSEGGRALAGGKSQFAPNVQGIPRFADAATAWELGLCAMMVSPMCWPGDGGRPVGTVSVMLPAGRDFSEVDVEFVEAFTDVLCRNIGAWRLGATAEAAVLRTVPAAGPEERHHLDALCRALRDLLGARVVSLFLADDEAGDLRAAGSTGFVDGRLEYAAIRYAYGEGLTGTVARTRGPVWGIIDEGRGGLAEGYPQLAGWAKKNPELDKRQSDPCRAFMAVPVEHNGVLIGVLRAGISTDGYAFSEVQFSALQRAANALGNLISEHRMRVRHEEVLAAAIEIGACEDLDSVLRMTLERAMQLLPQASAGSIMELDRGEEVFRFRAYLPAEFAAKTRGQARSADVNGSLSGRIYRLGKPLRHPDMQDPTVSPTAEAVNPESRASLGVPILTRLHPPLVLFVDSKKPDDFTEADEKLMVFFARIAQIVIDNSYLAKHQEAFLRLMGHQFGAPAIALRNFTNRVVSTIRNGPQHRLESLAKGLEAQATVTAHVANNITNVFRVLDEDDSRARAQLRCERVELLAYAMGNARMYQGYARAHARLTISCEGATLGAHWGVNVDRSLLDQVMWNLLDNAIKYSLPGTTVTILGEETESAYRVYVQNYGIPVREGEVKDVFKLHWRSPLAERVAPVGGGLGLPVARRIAQLHDGDLDAEPSERDDEKGAFLTTFILTLPKLRRRGGDGNHGEDPHRRR